MIFLRVFSGLFGVDGNNNLEGVGDMIVNGNDNRLEWQVHPPPPPPFQKKKKKRSWEEYLIKIPNAVRSRLSLVPPLSLPRSSVGSAASESETDIDKPIWSDVMSAASSADRQLRC